MGVSQTEFNEQNAVHAGVMWSYTYVNVSGNKESSNSIVQLEALLQGNQLCNAPMEVLDR